MNNSTLLEKYLRIMIIYKYLYIANILIAIFLNLLVANPISNNGVSPEKIKLISLRKLGSTEHLHFKNKILHKNLVLLFFSSKNFESQKIISDIQNIRSGINNSNVQYFLINNYDNDLILSSMVQKNVWTIPILIDEFSLATSVFNIKSVPSVIVLNKENANISFKTNFSETGVLDLISHIKLLR